MSDPSAQSIHRSASPLPRRIVEAHGLAGLAVGVVQHGDIAYAEGFGVQRIGAPEPVTPHLVFRQASVTKPFVAVAILEPVEAGKFRLVEPATAQLIGPWTDNVERWWLVALRWPARWSDDG